MATFHGGSLFERLAGSSTSYAGKTAKECLLASVAAHLSKMLSTRAGSVQTLPDYGLPDFNDSSRSAHDVLMDSRRAIEAFVQRYEPRLSAVTVDLDHGSESSLKLKFRIQGILSDGRNRYPVEFEAQLEVNGQFAVRQHKQ